MRAVRTLVRSQGACPAAPSVLSRGGSLLTLSRRLLHSDGAAQPPPPPPPPSRRPVASAADAKHCEALVRSADHDYWLMGLLLPAKARPGFYAVRAFNVETAQVVDAVRGNVLTGKMRLQWWQEAVAAIYASTPRNGGGGGGFNDDDRAAATAAERLPQGYPVLNALADAVAVHGLSQRWLDRTLEARMTDLELGQGCPRSVQDLERYCAHAHGSLTLLALECLAGGSPSPSSSSSYSAAAADDDADADSYHLGADLAATHLGTAAGLCTLLRGHASHASHFGRHYVPADLLAKHGARSRALLMGPVDHLWPDLDDPSADAAYEDANPGEGEARRKRRRSPPLTEDEKVRARAAVAEVAALARNQLAAAEALCAGRPPPPPPSEGRGTAAAGHREGGAQGENAGALAAALAACGPVPAGLLPAFWPALRCAEYLAALERCGHDLHHPDLWPAPAHEQRGAGPLGFRLRLLGSKLGLVSPFARR